MAHPARSHPTLLLLLALLAPLALLATPAGADEPTPPVEEPGESEEPAPEKLVEHPLADAEPGEYLRFVVEQDGWKKWYVERVLAVKDGRVLLAVAQTNEDASRDLSAAAPTRWIEVPERLQKGEHQRILSDEMEVLEVAGQEILCRHLHIEEPLQPPFADPKVRRHVWYSNQVPATGKVKESTTHRTAIGWGTMTAEELEQARKAYPDPEARAPSGDGDADDDDGEADGDA